MGAAENGDRYNWELELLLAEASDGLIVALLYPDPAMMCLLPFGRHSKYEVGSVEFVRSRKSLRMNACRILMLHLMRVRRAGS